MQNAPVQQEGPPADGARGGAGLGVCLGLLWVAWVLVPAGLLLAGVGETLTFFGEPRTEAAEARARALSTQAAVVAVAVPALGLVGSLWGRRRVHAIAFGTALTVAGLVVLGVTLAAGYADPEEAPQQDSPGVVCQEHSGGDSDCPGG